MGADYSFYVKTIETHARAFLTLNILAIGRVICMQHRQSCPALVGPVVKSPWFTVIVHYVVQ